MTTEVPDEVEDDLEPKPYAVWFMAGASARVEVMATDEDTAVDKAYDFVPGSLCHHCASQIDIGDWEVDEVDPL